MNNPSNVFRTILHINQALFVLTFVINVNSIVNHFETLTVSINLINFILIITSYYLVNKTTKYLSAFNSYYMENKEKYDNEVRVAISLVTIGMSKIHIVGNVVILTISILNNISVYSSYFD